MFEGFEEIEIGSTYGEKKEMEPQTTTTILFGVLACLTIGMAWAVSILAKIAKLLSDESPELISVKGVDRSCWASKYHILYGSNGIAESYQRDFVTDVMADYIESGESDYVFRLQGVPQLIVAKNIVLYISRTPSLAPGIYEDTFETESGKPYTATRHAENV